MECNNCISFFLLENKNSSRIVQNNSKSIFIWVALLTFGLATTGQLAYAQTTQVVTISPGAGSGGENGPCVVTNSCFSPSVLNISLDDTVSWKNSDNVIHTVTSGHLTDPQTGRLFDDVISPGNLASYTFRSSGIVDYFCKIHPWLVGQVIVGTPVTTGGVHLGNMGISSVGKQPIMTMLAGTVSAASTQVAVTAPPPISGSTMTIIVNFKDAQGNLVQNENYDMSATQDGNYVLSISNGHANTGTDTQVTSKLRSSNPVDIKITLNGVGLSGTDPATWTGPKYNIIYFHIIPEFGPIVGLIVAISLIIPIIISRKFLKTMS